MNRLKKILIDNIWLKISAFNSLGVLSRVLSGWIINKLIAIYIGPQGTTLSEQLRNFLQTIEGFSTLGIQEGVTKYGAKYQNNSKQLTSFLSTSYKIVLITSFFLGISIFVFSKTINQLIFPEYSFHFIIKLTGILLPISAINIVIQAIIRGFQEYKKITYISITSNFFTALIALYLIYNFHLTGALILVLITQIISFVVSLFYLRKDIKKILKISFNNTDKKHFQRLFAYIIMAMISSVIVPIFTILIRNLIFEHYSGDLGIHAGYWDAVKKISGLFISLILPVFGLYYYPRLAKIHTNIELKKEIKKFLKQIVPFFSIGILLLYLLRYWVILLFYSKAYLPSENLFLWQIFGDYLRVLSMTLAFLMLAKAHVRKYLIMEIGFWLVYYISSYILLKKYQLYGITIAYFISYVFYLSGLIFIYRKFLFNKKEILIK